MKKVAFILTIFVLFLAITPCCLAEYCQSENANTETTKQKKAGTEPDFNLCSPFFGCPNCHGFTCTLNIAKLLLFYFPNAERYIAFQQNFVSIFTPSIWQPPKINSSLSFGQVPFFKKVRRPII